MTPTSMTLFSTWTSLPARHTRTPDRREPPEHVGKQSKRTAVGPLSRGMDEMTCAFLTVAKNSSKASG
jgi:hypothetical protein